MLQLVVVIVDNENIGKLLCESAPDNWEILLQQGRRRLSAYHGRGGRGVELSKLKKTTSSTTVVTSSDLTKRYKMKMGAERKHFYTEPTSQKFPYLRLYGHHTLALTPLHSLPSTLPEIAGKIVSAMVSRFHAHADSPDVSACSVARCSVAGFSAINCSTCSFLVTQQPKKKKRTALSRSLSHSKTQGKTCKGCTRSSHQSALGLSRAYATALRLDTQHYSPEQQTVRLRKPDQTPHQHVIVRYESLPQAAFGEPYERGLPPRIPASSAATGVVVLLDLPCVYWATSGYSLIEMDELCWQQGWQFCPQLLEYRDEAGGVLCITIGTTKQNGEHRVEIGRLFK
ncbi:hypothetical protein DFH94DRAFT_847412 [Russula ochroleuca]|uniref:Uncharacterized protein n=1 Tax=Russula ochroleuca TaxID=152965 RepID=A0A9P5JY54_9AGAM|nr:hypothetical protein DFH94DRAFT_847412 [Russula ochroleuca]